MYFLVILVLLFAAFFYNYLVYRDTQIWFSPQGLPILTNKLHHHHLRQIQWTHTDGLQSSVWVLWISYDILLMIEWCLRIRGCRVRDTHGLAIESSDIKALQILPTSHHVII